MCLCPHKICSLIAQNLNTDWREFAQSLQFKLSSSQEPSKCLLVLTLTRSCPALKIKVSLRPVTVTKVDLAALSPVLDYRECSQFDFVTRGLQLKLEVAIKDAIVCFITRYLQTGHFAVFHRDPSPAWLSATALSRRWTHSKITHTRVVGRVKS